MEEISLKGRLCRWDTVGKNDFRTFLKADAPEQ